jgi:large subunit ribosomal protein L9
MEVILLEKIDNLGSLGDLVKVRSGYGRNFLIPSGKAVFATAENRAKLEAHRAELEKAAAEVLAEAKKRQEALTDMTFTIARKVGDEGKLFGSVGTIDISDGITNTGVKVSKQEVRLPAGPIRQTGEYIIDLHLHPEVNAQVKIVIVAEEEGQ